MKLKLFLSLIMICLAGSFLVVWAQGPGTSIVLTAPIEQVRAGETVTVSISIEAAAGAYGGRVKLSYDTQRFEVLTTDNNAVTAGDFFGGQPGITLKNQVTDGLVDYAVTLRRPAEPVDGDGVLGTINFRALADGAARFELTEATLLSPRFEVVNGQTIARQIDEIPLQLQALTLSVSGESVEPLTQPVVEEAVEVMTQEQPQALEVPVLTNLAPSLSPVLVIGIVFFVLGLVMFMFSLLSYAHLRQNFRMVY